LLLKTKLQTAPVWPKPSRPVPAKPVARRLFVRIFLGAEL
jgi:hypothetical protein